MSLLSKLFSFGNGSKSTDNIAAARERANKRIHEKAFAETVLDNNLRDSLDFVVNGVTVFEDGYNSHGVALTPEQMNTIGLIFDGYALPAKHRAANSIGSTPQMASGVPLNLTALDDRNIVDQSKVEYLEPEYTWPEAHIRG
jgi:hypothetical protein